MINLFFRFILTPFCLQSSLSNVASGFNVRNIPLVYSQASVISTSAGGTYPSIQDPNLGPVTFRSSSSLCKGDSGLQLTVNFSPRIPLPLGGRLLFKPFSSFSTSPPPITWSSPSGVGSSVITGPVISGMIGYYSAASWASTQWNDLSGAGNHATEVGGGGISVVPATNLTPAYLRGKPFLQYTQPNHGPDFLTLFRRYLGLGEVSFNNPAVQRLHTVRCGQVIFLSRIRIVCRV